MHRGIPCHLSDGLVEPLCSSSATASLTALRTTDSISSRRRGSIARVCSCTSSAMAPRRRCASTTSTRCSTRCTKYSSTPLGSVAAVGDAMLAGESLATVAGATDAAGVSAGAEAAVCANGGRAAAPPTVAAEAGARVESRCPASSGGANAGEVAGAGEVARAAITAGGRALGNGGRSAGSAVEAAGAAAARATNGGGEVITVVRADDTGAPGPGTPSGTCTTSVRVGTKRGGVRGGCLLYTSPSPRDS